MSTIKRFKFAPRGVPFVVELSSKTLQGRFLLRPSKEVNSVILGIIGRALATYSGVKLHALSFVSNHFHILASSPSTKEISDFMCLAKSCIARKVGPLNNWHGKFWEHRFDSIEVLDDEAQLRRLRYIVTHGAKEGLVEKSEQWPGVHSVFALRDGVPLKGIWRDQTKEYEARIAGKEVTPGQFDTEYTVVLSPLPCWANLSAEDYAKQFGELLRDEEADCQTKREQAGKTSVLGVMHILTENSHDAPAQTKRSRRPACHTSSKELWKEYKDRYREFVQNFRTAAKRLRDRLFPVTFPDGCFWPAIGYVEDGKSVANVLSPPIMAVQPSPSG
jgi:REP element-mobilizing transposase RayT